MNYNETKKAIENTKARSAWSKGVKLYALEILTDLEENYPGPELNSFDEIKKAALSGARNWEDFSCGGCSLIYNGDIAARLCNSTELKKTANGDKEPNARETWLDIQARALYQAFNLICNCVF